MLRHIYIGMRATKGHLSEAVAQICVRMWASAWLLSKKVAKRVSEISPLVAVDRAIGEFRRALPVMITDPALPGACWLALPAELAQDGTLATLGRLGADVPQLVLTHNRARTLKIRLYTPEIVLLPQPQWGDAAAAREIADPSRDLEHPLRGPFTAARDLRGAGWMAAVKLAKLAQLLPAALVVQLPDMDAEAQEAFLRQHDLLRVGADAILDYDMAAANALVQVTGARVPLAGAENARLIAFRPADGGIEHLAIVIGDPKRGTPVLARLHSECFTGDLIGSLKCDCGEQLRGAIAQIGEAGSGILLYLAQEGRGIGLINKLRAYGLQDQGFDTNEANERLGFEVDERVFLPAARMLALLGFSQVRLMTNNPDKVAGLERLGIDVVERVPHKFPSNEHNRFYLSTKRDKSGHLL